MHLGRILSGLVFLAATCSASSEPVAVKGWQTRFVEAEKSSWELRRLVSQRPSLVFKEKEGLEFTSDGLDVLVREWPIGTAPFEAMAEFEIRNGTAEVFDRNRGVMIVFSSAPVDTMGSEDWALVLGVTQTGVLVQATQGGARWGVEKRPGLLHFGGKSVVPRFSLSMAGAGGQSFSVRWPTKIVNGTKVRIWVARKADGTLSAKIFNADGMAAPWWEGTAPLPEDLQAVPLRYVTIHTGREASDFADPSQFAMAAGQGSGPMDGVIRQLEVRTLPSDGEVTLAEPFPAATMADVGTGMSLFLPPEKLAALREKFGAPEFSDYRKVILQTVKNESPSFAYGSAGQNERLFSLLWAYTLTGDRVLYWDALLAEIDAFSGVTDKLPAEVFEFPGKMRQWLMIREFNVQGMAALALAFDLVGAELDTVRRDRIRYLLVRSMQDYHRLLDRGDWWYGENPSNTIGVGNGAMGIVALALKNQAPELSQKTVERAVKNIETLFKGVDKDGGSIEGAMYWHYGLCYPNLFGWALRQVTGDDRGLLDSPQVRNAMDYVAVSLGGNQKMVPFNDSQPWLIGWPVMAAAGTEANSGLARWMADWTAKTYANAFTYTEQSRSTYSVPAFLYRDRIAAPEEFPGLPNVATLGSVHEGVMRSDGKQLVPAMVTAVKGKGAESTHHANQDQGSFVFYADGEMILLDPGYFEDSPQSHSLPLIGDIKTMNLDPKVLCPLSEVWESGVVRSMTVDSTAAYNSGKNEKNPLALRVRRTFVQVGQGALVILDDVRPKDPSAEITAQYQVGVPAEIFGSRALLKGSAGPIQLQTFGPEVQLTATPREFSKDWVFKKAGIPWTTLRGSHRADRPLITVLSRSKEAAAEVEYGPEKITVTVPGSQAVAFKKSEDLWVAVKP
jgi:hypothetical protein